MFSQYKKIIIGVLVFTAAFFTYSFFKDDISDKSGSLSITEQKSVNILGQDIVRVLNRIKSINLDRGIFNDPVYNNLIDRSSVIADQPVGRENIFSSYSAALVEEDSEETDN